MKFVQPSFANETIKLDSIVGLLFAWHPIIQGEGAASYALSIGKDRGDSRQLTLTDDTTAVVTYSDLQAIMRDYFPGSREADVKVYCTANFNGCRCSTDSMTIHLKASAKVGNPWFMIGSCIGDGEWSNSVDGMGKSIYPLADGDNINYFRSGDIFMIVKNFSWSGSWGSSDGGINNLTNAEYRNNITIPSDGWYNVHMTTVAPTITAVSDHVETVYNAVTLSTGSQTVTLSPMSSREHEAEYFAQFTLDSESKVSVNADDVSLEKDLTVKAGTYDVFINTQSKTCMIFEAGGSDFNDGNSSQEVNDALEPIPVTSVGTVELSDDVDSVQVVNIGRINAADEVHNVVLVVNNGKEINLSDDGRCAVSDVRGILSAKAQIYADYRSGDVITRRCSDSFDLTAKTLPSATMVTSDGTSYGMALGSTGIIGYGYLSGTVIVNHGDLSWTENVSDPGFYKAVIVTTTQSDGATSEKLSLTKINTISMIGDFTGWSSDIPMTYNAEDNSWEGTLTLTSAISNMKFRGNSDWSLNWGFLNDALSGYLLENGSNFTISTPNTYYVKVYLTYPGDSHYILSTTPTGINIPAAVDGPVKIYDLKGIGQKNPKSGVYIVRKNGQTRKVIIK